MNITIPQHVLARELALVAPLAEKKTTIPILSNVLITADGAGITLAATNLEQGITSRMDCTVREGGAFTIPARRLLDLTRTLTGDITLKTDDKSYVTVTAGRSRSRIPGMSAESFPELPTAPEPVAEVDAKLFARHMSRVAFAISAEESRFTLNGALVEFDGYHARAVATDGHRLAYAEAPCAGGPASLKMLVPKRAITEYAKLADASEGGARVAIAQDENHLFFTVGPRSIMARKMTGNFPDYARVLPKHEAHVVVDSGELKAALGRVAQFADERSRAVRFTLGNGEIAMMANSMEIGESAESLPCEGDATAEVAFNGQYILDALAACGSTRVALFIADGKSAGEMRPMRGAGTEQDAWRVDDSVRVVVMPMRI